MIHALDEADFDPQSNVVKMLDDSIGGAVANNPYEHYDYHGVPIEEWLDEQLNSPKMRRDLINPQELQKQSTEFLEVFYKALETGELKNLQAPGWAPVLQLLGDLSRQRGRQGFTPSETALFVFSLKPPMVAPIATVPSRITPFFATQTRPSRMK